MTSTGSLRPYPPLSLARGPWVHNAPQLKEWAKTRCNLFRHGCLVRPIPSASVKVVFTLFVPTPVAAIHSEDSMLPARRWLRPSARARLRELVPVSLWRGLKTVKARDSKVQRGRGLVQASRELSSLPASMAETLAPLIQQGRGYVAHVVTSFRSGDALDEHFSIVGRVLNEAGVEYTALPRQTNRRRIVVVAEESQPAVLGALASELSATYACVLSEDGAGRPRRLATLNSVGPLEGLRIFRFLVDAGGRSLSGSRLGCDIQFWRRSTSSSEFNDQYESFAVGSLTAPRLRNAWSDVLPPAEQGAAGRALSASTPPAPGWQNHPHVFEVTYPIDVVYTWVDGSDPDWLERKREAFSNDHDPLTHALSKNESRFLSREELRYSLRSLEMHADWVRHVYLVTDRQVPSWLKTEHPRLTVVDHTELFAGRGRLPTFNSHAIESQLHHIEGLSEHFLYLNDDMFFGRAVTPELFFHSNGMSKFFCSTAKIGLGAPRPIDTPVVSAGKNNRRLLEESFGVSITSRLQHAPYALRRSVLREIEQRYPEGVTRTASSQFRSATDLSIPSSLSHYYGYLTGRAVPGELRYFYADIARRETPLRLDQLSRDRDVDAFCLNDVDFSERDVGKLQSLVGDFLDGYFPLPSSFEKDGA